MSSYYQIFLRTEQAESQLVADVAAAIGNKLTPVQSAQSTVSYAGMIRDDAVVEIEMTHELEDDMGIEFSRYPVVITVRTATRDRAFEEAAATELFRKLSENDSYQMVLVYSISQRLATHL